MNRNISWKLLSLLSLSLSLFGVIVLGLALSLSSPGIAAAGPATQGDYPANTITVSGFGQAAGAPDVAYLQLGLDIVSQDLGQAVSDADSGLDAIVAALAGLGIAPEDIQTVNFSVWTEEGPYGPDGMPAQTERRYRVNNILRIVVRDTSLVSQVIDAGIDAGANAVHGLTFGIDEADALESEARLEAIADAEARAAELAAAVGASLGEAIVVNEGASGGGFPMAYAESAMGLGGGGSIQEGQLNVSVQVQVTYTLLR